MIRISGVFSDTGRDVKWAFCSHGHYFTEYFSFTDEKIQEKMEAIVKMGREEREATRLKELEESYWNGTRRPDEDRVLRFNRKEEIYPEFSNFYECPVTFDGRTYRNAEAAWQSMKSMDPGFRDNLSRYAATTARTRGRKVELRPDWEEVKHDLMYEVCLAKFTQNPELGKLLLSTGDFWIIEDTTKRHDNVWGECTCDKCRQSMRCGQNGLGKALMRVREKLKE